MQQTHAVVSVDYPLRLSPLTEDTSMITVSSCGIKLQELLSGLEKMAKTLGLHMHFCGFTQHYYITNFFLSTCTAIDKFLVWGCTFFFS